MVFWVFFAHLLSSQNTLFDTQPKPFHLRLTTVNYFQLSFTASVNSAANPSRRHRNGSAHNTSVTYLPSTQQITLIISIVCTYSYLKYCIQPRYVWLLFFHFALLTALGSQIYCQEGQGVQRTREIYIHVCTLSQMHIKKLNFLLERAT